MAKLPGVVVGKTLAKQLGVGLGDCVQVTSPTIGMSIGAAGARPPIAKQFRVIALFEAGFDQYDSKLVYTDLYEAQAFYDQGDSVTGVEMRVEDIDQASPIAREIEALLANSVYHDGLDGIEPRALHRAPHPAARNEPFSASSSSSPPSRWSPPQS